MIPKKRFLDFLDFFLDFLDFFFPPISLYSTLSTFLLQSHMRIVSSRDPDYFIIKRG